MLYSDSHFWKQHVEPLYVSAIQRHLGANIQQNFFLQISSHALCFDTTCHDLSRHDIFYT